jgi:hypothetical protein
MVPKLLNTCLGERHRQPDRTDPRTHLGAPGIGSVVSVTKWCNPLMAKNEDARSSAGLAASAGYWGLARCGRPTRRGTPCKRRPAEWHSDWPEPQEPGACYVHMPDADRRAQVRHVVADERKFGRKRDQAEPACWSWPAPAAGTGNGMDTLLPGTDEWEFLASWQDGRCAICGSSPKTLVTDHDHLTGLVRGLLCYSCNAVEGHAGEGSKGMIASYRRRHPAIILGLTVPYVDPWTGQYYSRDFTLSARILPTGHCSGRARAARCNGE